jgi:hypothetical protein
MLTAVLECLAALCLVGLCAIGALFTRRVMIRRRGGAFDCSLRLTPALPGEARAAAFPTAYPYSTAAASTVALPQLRNHGNRGWSYGIAQYGADHIDWYRIFSYALGPAAVLTRRDLEVLGHRAAAEHEELALFPGWCVIECRFGTGLVELAMAPDSMTGFLSWLEAAPPGQGISRVS